MHDGSDTIFPVTEESLNRTGVGIDDPIVLAVSGGLDSAVLATVIAVRGYRNAVIGHVDHGIRTQRESTRDLETVNAIAERTGLPVISRRIRPGRIVESAGAENGGVEAVARAMRYNALHDILEEFITSLRNGGRTEAKEGVILTAHHMEDNAETVLMRFVTGRSPFETVSISERSVLYGYTVIRPFLQISRDTLAAYAKSHGVPWRTDSTNYDQLYSRNYLRKSVIPAIRRRYPQATAAVTEFAQGIGELQTAVTELIPDSAWGSIQPSGGVTIDRRLFERLPGGAREIVLRKALQSVSRSHRLTVKSVRRIVERDLEKGPEQLGPPRIIVGDVEMHYTPETIELVRRVVRSSESGYLLEVCEGTFIAIDEGADSFSRCSGEATGSVLRFGPLEPPIVFRTPQRGDTIRAEDKDRRLTDITAPGRDGKPLSPKAVLEDRRGIAVVFLTASQWKARKGVDLQETDVSDDRSVSIQIQD